MCARHDVVMTAAFWEHVQGVLHVSSCASATNRLACLAVAFAYMHAAQCPSSCFGNVLAKTASTSPAHQQYPLVLFAAMAAAAAMAATVRSIGAADNQSVKCHEAVMGAPQDPASAGTAAQAADEMYD
jgi:hypothetical protein